MVPTAGVSNMPDQQEDLDPNAAGELNGGLEGNFGLGQSITEKGVLSNKEERGSAGSKQAEFILNSVVGHEVVPALECLESNNKNEESRLAGGSQTGISLFLDSEIVRSSEDPQIASHGTSQIADLLEGADNELKQQENGRDLAAEQQIGADADIEDVLDNVTLEEVPLELGTKEELGNSDAIGACEASVDLELEDGELAQSLETVRADLEESYQNGIRAGSQFVDDMATRIQLEEGLDSIKQAPQESVVEGGVEADAPVADSAQLQPETVPGQSAQLENDLGTNGSMMIGAGLAVGQVMQKPLDTTSVQVPLEASAGPDDSQQQVSAEEAADIGPIPFFIISNTARKAASPRLSNDTIDFGVPGARITSDRFVGVRYVREGGDPSESGSASPGARLLGVIQDLPAMTVAAAEKTVASMLSVLPSPKKSKSEAEKTPTGSAEPLRRSSALQEQEAGAGNEPTGAAAEASASSSAPAEQRESSNSPELHVWEIIWKDHSQHRQDRPGGPLQQVQFETTKAGFRFIQRIIDVWSLEATDSSAMTHAAKAVYKAQDMMHESQPDYPLSNAEQPDTSSFPRSLFGKARAAVNGALAGPSASEALQRAASDDVRSSISAVDRTESGVSAADSVESFSSARSNASGGNVAIALVASGNKNGYEGGLHHVVIPETEPVAGPPPPEKLGAPLVEGRFLPNMHPHSHILQQPHIRSLAAALPVRYRLSPWVLLYSTWRDGISLQTLYRKAFKKGPGIMVILDTNHNVFGCYTSEPWKVHPRYYGSGECFVFQLYPEMRVYRWTRDNNYFMFGTPDSIHIGGGSHFALSVSGDLLSGCTGSCETFGNGPLVKPDEYGILHVELWGVQ